MDQETEEVNWIKRITLGLVLATLAVPIFATSHVDLVGAPPAPYTLQFRRWYQELLSARIDECDDARGTTYYISTATASPAGSSANDGLSSSAPKLASDVNTLLGSSNREILFRRDQEYGISSRILFTQDDCKIGAYGDGKAPLIHCFNYHAGDGAISTVGNTTTIQINTTLPHRLQTGQTVLISGTSGAASGTINGNSYAITVVDTDTFSLDGTSAAGTGTGGTFSVVWTNAAGDRWTIPVTGEVGWPRDRTNNETRLTPYRHMNSTAGVEATPRSFYWVSNVLHINAGSGVDPNDINYEYSLKADADESGIDVSGADQTLIENIRLDGFGCYIGSTFNYGLRVISGVSTDRCVIRDCEVHYAGRHGMGSNEWLGSLVWLRCIVGQGIDSSAAYTNFVTYSPTLTGEEAIYEGCVATGGELPWTSYAGPWQNDNQAFFAHDNSNNTGLALCVVSNCRETETPWRTNYTVSTGNVNMGFSVGSDSDVTTLRTFVIDHTVERNSAATSLFGTNAKHVWINPLYDVNLGSTNTTQYINLSASASLSGGHVYNGIFRFRELNQGATQSRFLLAQNGLSTTKFENTSFSVEGATAGSSAFYNFWFNWSGGSSTAFFRNCLLIKRSNKLFLNGLGNSGTYFTNCAGYGTSTDTTNGFHLTPNFVTLQTPVDVLQNPSGTALEGAGTTTVLEYDQRWKARNQSSPSIGAMDVVLESDTDSEKLDTILARLGPWTGDTAKNSIYGGMRALANDNDGFASADLTKDDGDGVGNFDNTLASLTGVRAITALLDIQEDADVATGGSTTTVVGPASWSTVNDKYIGCRIVIYAANTNGAATGDIRTITDYVGSTRTATVFPAFSAAIAAGDIVFMLRETPTIQLAKESADANGIYLTTLSGQVASDIWDEARSGHTDPGTFGEGLNVISMSNNVITANAIATGAVDADAIATDAGTELANGLLDQTDGIETGYTLRGVIRLMIAALVGKTNTSGNVTTFRDLNDTVDRITATITGGKRSAVTVDPD